MTIAKESKLIQDALVSMLSRMDVQDDELNKIHVLMRLSFQLGKIIEASDHAYFEAKFNQTD